MNPFSVSLTFPFDRSLTDPQIESKLEKILISNHILYKTNDRSRVFRKKAELKHDGFAQYFYLLEEDRFIKVEWDERNISLSVDITLRVVAGFVLLFFLGIVWNPSLYGWIFVSVLAWLVFYYVSSSALGALEKYRKKIIRGFKYYT